MVANSTDRGIEPQVSKVDVPILKEAYDIFLSNASRDGNTDLETVSMSAFKKKLTTRLWETLVVSGERTVTNEMLHTVISIMTQDLKQEKAQERRGELSRVSQAQTDMDAARVSELRAQIGAYDIKAISFTAVDTDSLIPSETPTETHKRIDALVESASAAQINAYQKTKEDYIEGLGGLSPSSLIDMIRSQQYIDALRKEIVVFDQKQKLIPWKDADMLWYLSYSVLEDVVSRRKRETAEILPPFKGPYRLSRMGTAPDIAAGEITPEMIEACDLKMGDPDEDSGSYAMTFLVLLLAGDELLTEDLINRATDTSITDGYAHHQEVVKLRASAQHSLDNMLKAGYLIREGSMIRSNVLI